MAVLIFLACLIFWLWSRMVAPPPRKRASDLLRLDLGYTTAELWDMTAKIAPSMRQKKDGSGNVGVTVNVNTNAEIPGLEHHVYLSIVPKQAVP